MTTKTPRGLRNFNACNLRRSGIKWIGLRKTQTDPEFLQFESHFFGLRAGARVLLTYQSRYGLRTIKQIISRYAPPHENNTPMYMHTIARALHLPNAGIDQVLDLTDLATLERFVRGIVLHENGQQPFAPELIRSACLSALGRKSP